MFAGASDPVTIDGPLVSDGESLRVVDQIFEGLVGLKPGTTQVVPLLATSWKASPNGLSLAIRAAPQREVPGWDAVQRGGRLRELHALVPLPGPLQSSAVTYYWNTVFGGFAKPAAGNPGPDKSLYKGCKTQGQFSVSILLNRRSSSFIGALALTNFGMASPTALKKLPGRRGHGGLERRLPPDRHIRDAASGGHRPVDARLVAGRPGADARPQPELLGREGEARPRDHPADRRQRRPSAGAAERRDPGLRPGRSG